MLDVTELDTAHRSQLQDYGFEAAYPTLVCETDPPLLLTHEPLETAPPGTANVHRHLRGTAARTRAGRPRRHLTSTSS